MAIQTRIINGSYAEIYVGRGNFITQSAPTNFHQFYTRKILTESESIDDFREVTASQKATLEQADAKWKRPPQSFIDAWNTRCVVCLVSDQAIIKRNTFGRYNEETGFFELNGLTDITYEQALEIMRVPDVAASLETNKTLAYSLARTLFPINLGLGGAPLQDIGCSMPNVEVARFIDYYTVGSAPDTTPMFVTNTRGMFVRARKLKEVKGVLSLNKNDNMGVHFYGAFIGCSNLATIWLHGMCLDASLRDCASLRAECVAYMAEHAANTKSITLTLHPDAYARVTEEIFAAAAEKNITIAST